MPKRFDPGERDIRLRPRRPRVPRDEGRAWSRLYKSLIHLVRMTTRPSESGPRLSGGSGGAGRRPHLQRCAVRVTYSPNRVRGQWSAHGRYIARESATREAISREAGFSAGGDALDVAKILGGWQTAGDQRLFKLIVSPEFGERADLHRLTRDLLGRMEQDLCTPLEWVAAAHFNTGHPHVHIALRGRTNVGPLQLSRDYIKRGIRDHAETLCTVQLGFRTELDAMEAERREVDAPRVTSLDRLIAKQAFAPGSDGVFDLDALPLPKTELQRARGQFLASRLRTLATMCLAENTGDGRWRVDPTFLTTLRVMQTAGERQTMMVLTNDHARADTNAAHQGGALRGNASSKRSARSGGRRGA